MKALYLLLAFGFSIVLIACKPSDPNKSVDEGTVKRSVYTSDEIGWTMEIPKGWSIMEMESKQALDRKGREAIENVIDGEIDVSSLKHLIAFQKDQFNIFQSTSEPFEIVYEGEWEENNAVLKGIIYDTYSNQGISADTSATTIETIDGLDFHTYSFTIYAPSGEVLLKQKMFGRLINGFDFGVNINYNNKKDGDELLRAFKNSRFTKN